MMLMQGPDLKLLSGFGGQNPKKLNPQIFARQTTEVPEILNYFFVKLVVQVPWFDALSACKRGTCVLYYRNVIWVEVRHVGDRHWRSAIACCKIPSSGEAPILKHLIRRPLWLVRCLETPISQPHALKRITSLNLSIYNSSCWLASVPLIVFTRLTFFVCKAGLEFGCKHIIVRSLPSEYPAFPMLGAN